MVLTKIVTKNPSKNYNTKLNCNTPNYKYLLHHLLKSESNLIKASSNNLSESSNYIFLKSVAISDGPDKELPQEEK